MFPVRDLNPRRSPAVLTWLLIAANLVIFFFWQPFTQGDDAALTFLYEHAAVPCEVTQGRPISIGELATGRCLEEPAGRTFFPAKAIWLSILTSLFLHANLAHLLGNMWFLWIFGDNVEDRLGRLVFPLVYLAAGLAATLGFTWLRPDEVVPIIGASGAIAGVLGAYFVMFPFRPVLALAGFFVLPVPALIFIGLWFFAQFAVVDPGIAWEAHVAGFVVGVALTLVLRQLARGRARAR